MSTRGAILDNLEAAISGITTVGGYNTTTREVYRDAILSEDAATTDPVYNVVDPGADEILQYGASSKVRSSMRLVVEAIVRGASIDAAQATEIENVVADIRKMIHAGPSLGATVCFVRIEGIETVTIGEIVAFITFALRIDYGYTTTSP